MPDHVMNLCQLSRVEFKGDIYMTEGTLKLAEHITLDGVSVHTKTIEYLNKQSKKGKTLYPYMDLRSRQYALDRVKAYGFDSWIELAEGIRFKFLHAGHISYAAMILIEVRDGYDVETILYTGDTSANRDIPMTHKPNIEKLKINHLITESTYAQVHIPQRTEGELIEDLYNIIKDSCINKDADVLLPSFAMSRSTNIAYYLMKTYEKYPELNKIPIYMASPLMAKCHKTISEGFDDYDEQWQSAKDLFRWSKIQTITEYKDVVRIAGSSGGKIFVSSSGMMDNGYNIFLTNHIVKSRKNTICIVGYCAENTVGYKLLKGEQKTLTSNIDGEKVTVNVRAKIKNIQGLSSHASGQEIIKLIQTAEQKKLRTVICVHGDNDRATKLGEMFKTAYKNPLDVYIPRSGQKIKLT